MKAVRFHGTGGPEVLVYEDVPDPAPADGEVLIRVEAVGLNFADVMRRRGDDYPEPSPPPFTLGGEVAGTVAALGEGVAGLNVGDAVFATPGVGGYAQYIRVPAPMVIPLRPGHRQRRGHVPLARVELRDHADGLEPRTLRSRLPLAWAVQGVHRSRGVLVWSSQAARQARGLDAGLRAHTGWISELSPGMYEAWRAAVLSIRRPPPSLWSRLPGLWAPQEERP